MYHFLKWYMSSFLIYAISLPSTGWELQANFLSAFSFCPYLTQLYEIDMACLIRAMNIKFKMDYESWHHLRTQEWKSSKTFLLKPDSSLYFTPLILPNKMSWNRSDRSRGSHCHKEPYSSDICQLSCYRSLAWFLTPTSSGKTRKHKAAYTEN